MGTVRPLSSSLESRRADMCRTAAQLFREHEDASVREMAQLDTEDMKGYVSMARLHIANLENALASDKDVFQRNANAARDTGVDASAS